MRQLPLQHASAAEHGCRARVPAIAADAFEAGAWQRYLNVHVVEPHANQIMLVLLLLRSTSGQSCWLRPGRAHPLPCDDTFVPASLVLQSTAVAFSTGSFWTRRIFFHAMTPSWYSRWCCKALRGKAVGTGLFWAARIHFWLIHCYAVLLSKCGLSTAVRTHMQCACTVE